MTDTDRMTWASEWRDRWLHAQQSQAHGLATVTEWHLQDHRAIPSPIRLGIQLAFRTGRIKSVPIEDINAWLNAVWDERGLEGYLEREALLWEGANFSPSDPPKRPR